MLIQSFINSLLLNHQCKSLHHSLIFQQLWLPMIAGYSHLSSREHRTVYKSHAQAACWSNPSKTPLPTFQKLPRVPIPQDISALCPKGLSESRPLIRWSLKAQIQQGPEPPSRSWLPEITHLIKPYQEIILCPWHRGDQMTGDPEIGQHFFQMDEVKFSMNLLYLYFFYPFLYLLGDLES